MSGVSTVFFYTCISDFGSVWLLQLWPYVVSYLQGCSTVRPWGPVSVPPDLPGTVCMICLGPGPFSGGDHLAGVVVQRPGVVEERQPPVPTA